MANIKTMKEVTGADKVFYVGYSRGSVQMHYGMAHRESDFYADNVYKSISLAPCFVKNDYTFAKNEKSFDASLM